MAFKGTHAAGRSNKNVKALLFKNVTVHYIPRNLSTIFPNLHYLLIAKCYLKEVTVEDMAGLERLEIFWVPDNNITTVPVDLFQNMPHLEQVGFSRNLIQKFDLKALKPIENTIKYFSILDNPGISDKFEKRVNEFGDFIKRLELTELNKESSSNLRVMSERLETLEKESMHLSEQLKLAKTQIEKAEAIDRRFEHLFTTEKHSDFTIKVRDKEYRVHKSIIAAQSSVFDKLISENPGVATESFDNIRYFSEEAIDEFIRYFYVKEDPSQKNVLHLLELSVEFDVPELRSKSETIANQGINPENALECFNLAVKRSLPSLKRASFDAIKKAHPEVFEFSYDKPALVNAIIEAKDEFQAKKIKLEEEE